MQIYQFQTSAKFQKFLFGFCLDALCMCLQWVYLVLQKKATKFFWQFRHIGKACNQWNMCLFLRTHIYHILLAINIEYSICLARMPFSLFNELWMSSVQSVRRHTDEQFQMIASFARICWCAIVNRIHYILDFVDDTLKLTYLTEYIRKPIQSVCRGVKFTYCNISIHFMFIFRYIFKNKTRRIHIH